MDYTIERVLKDLEDYKPKYRYIAGLSYEAPEHGQTLIPKRLLRDIEKTANLDSKIRLLNEREQHYNKVVRITRTYPLWIKCTNCRENTAFLTRKRDLKLCEMCKNIRR